MASKPKLTIGMAVYDDYDGVYFTVQALRLYHDLRDVEILIVDNNPTSASSGHIHNLVNRANGQGDTAGVRHIGHQGVVGTASPRNRVFEEAQAPWVMCMDSHVMLPPGAVSRLLAHIDEHPEQRDMLCGPLWYDPLDPKFVATHFIDMWRSEMWGVWGQAWQFPTFGGERFTVIQNKDLAEFQTLDMDPVPISRSARTGAVLPAGLAYSGHERVLRDLGYVQLGVSNDDVFEVPGQGLGLFVARRDMWMEVGGFNPLFRGFGGEELYIHEKFRQHGAKTYCLGFLKWVHRFATPQRTKYPNTRWDKIRNYVLGFLELGRSLDPVHHHFVRDLKLMKQVEWDALVADPRAPLPTVQIQQATNLEGKAGIEPIYELVRNTPRDLDQHMPKLRELAGRCPNVTEISNRKESLVALAAAGPAVLISHNTEAGDPIIKMLSRQIAFSLDNRTSDAIETIAATDMLFLDSIHTKAALSEELAKYAPAVARYIVIHDTALHADKGEDGGPGLVEAIREFLRANKDWFIAEHTGEQFGLTVLGRQAADRPLGPDGLPTKLRIWPRGFGPGTELMNILKTLHVEEKPGCPCRARARQMDEWGPAVCREHLDEIVGWMREGAPRWGWTERLRAAAAAVATGLVFELDWLDPFPTLVTKAIELAEERGEPDEED